MWFRIGEILYLMGEPEKALIRFDASETILKNKETASKINSYRIMVKIAHTYWLLGSEYYHLALQKTMESEEVFKKLPKKDDDDKNALTNNLCWYSLEVYTNSDKNQKDELRSELEKRYSKLEKLLNKEVKNSSIYYDTAAWYQYIMYKEKGDIAYLRQAKKYCNDIINAQEKESSSYISKTIASITLQGNHIKTILATK